MKQMQIEPPQIFSADKIFTGSEWLIQKALVVKDGIIAEIIDAPNPASAPAGHSDIIAPAFMDIQIYGAYKQLFSVFPTVEALQLMYAYCKTGGAAHFQPTVATNSTEVFYQCIDAVKAYWQAGGKGCLGLHIEGPWINPQKRGAHLEAFIHIPDYEEVRALLEYGKGVITMITLAPEICSKEIIMLIRSYDIIISAGHSNASYEEAFMAFDEGIETATHLFNAMSPLQHRAPGMVGAIFNHPTVRSSIVPDGFHVDFAAVKIASTVMNKRLFAITDAVTETTSGPYPHQPAGEKYISNDILSGSALNMAKCLKNLVTKCDIPLEEALRMVSLYPAEVMKRSHQLGKMALGVQANFVVLAADLSLKEIILGE